jgi:Flp pilus assembly pilin Flp
LKNLKDFLKDDQGVELAEYAVGVALLVIIAIVVYNVLGRAINDKMSAVASEIEG